MFCRGSRSKPAILRLWTWVGGGSKMYLFYPFFNFCLHLFSSGKWPIWGTNISHQEEVLRRWFSFPPSKWDMFCGWYQFREWLWYRMLATTSLYVFNHRSETVFRCSKENSCSTTVSNWYFEASFSGWTFLGPLLISWEGKHSKWR